MNTRRSQKLTVYKDRREAPDRRARIRECHSYGEAFGEDDILVGPGVISTDGETVCVSASNGFANLVMECYSGCSRWEVVEHSFPFTHLTFRGSVPEVLKSLGEVLVDKSVPEQIAA